jgi:hypothetical protein
MLPKIAPSTPLSRQEIEKEQAHRRKLVYKWYKHYAKPTRANMYSIVDFYANLDYYDNKDSDIKRQDVDFLPWNIEGTAVIKEAMKSKKENKKDKKEKKNLEETKVIKKEAIKLKSLKRKTEKKVKIKRQDVDLLLWNIEGTEIINEAMKSKKENKKKKDKQEKKNLEEIEIIKKEAIKLKSLERKTEKKVKQEKQKDKKAEFEAEAAHSPKSTVSSMGAWPIQYCIDDC